MTATIVGLVTPHLLRVVDLANDAEKGINVDWHVRDAVGRTQAELDQHYNGPDLIRAYVEGIANAAAQAPPHRVDYVRVLNLAVSVARRAP